jgi:hypothetical protein
MGVPGVAFPRTMNQLELDVAARVNMVYKYRDTIALGM